jgi:ligand-binding sensor domain-containing protein
MRTLCRIAVFAWFLCTGAFAASPDGFTRKLWQTQDGLPEQTVQAFAQTPDHYLWIGTTGGLLRFDGARFTTFDHENTPELRENSVFALLVSRDGSLWIGTEGGGLIRYHAGKFRAYGLSDGLSDGFVRAIYEDHNGTIWIGTDNGLLRFADDRLVRVDGVHGNSALAVHAIAEDHLGGLWVGGSLLVRLDHGVMIGYRLEGGSSQNRVKSILETADHTVWVGTVSGLHRLPLGSRTFERVHHVNGTVRALRQTSDGTLWIGTIGQGIRSTNGRDFSAITAPEALPSNTVLNIFEDDERNVWVGTQAGTSAPSLPIAMEPFGLSPPMCFRFAMAWPLDMRFRNSNVHRCAMSFAIGQALYG